MTRPISSKVFAGPIPWLQSRQRTRRGGHCPRNIKILTPCPPLKPSASGLERRTCPSRPGDEPASRPSPLPGPDFRRILGCSDDRGSASHGTNFPCPRTTRHCFSFVDVGAGWSSVFPCVKRSCAFLSDPGGSHQVQAMARPTSVFRPRPELPEPALPAVGPEEDVRVLCTTDPVVPAVHRVDHQAGTGSHHCPARHTNWPFKECPDRGMHHQP